MAHNVRRRTKRRRRKPGQTRGKRRAQRGQPPPPPPPPRVWPGPPRPPPAPPPPSGAEIVMYVDTIGALLEYAGELDASLFDGEVVSVDLRSGSAQRRLFHNPRKGSYAPRVTWWPGSAFKVEFSVSKMAGLAPGANVSVADTEKALD